MLSRLTSVARSFFSILLLSVQHLYLKSSVVIPDPCVINLLYIYVLYFFVLLTVSLNLNYPLYAMNHPFDLRLRLCFYPIMSFRSLFLWSLSSFEFVQFVSSVLFSSILVKNSLLGFLCLYGLGIFQAGVSLYLYHKTLICEFLSRSPNFLF